MYSTCKILSNVSFAFQGPSSSNTLRNIFFFEDFSDEEIFPTKRSKISDSVEIEENHNSNEYRAPQNVYYNEIEPTNIQKQNQTKNRDASSIIITSTGKHNIKAKTGVEYLKNNDLRSNVKVIEPEGAVYLSPSTGKTCQLLQNVTFPFSSAPTIRPLYVHLH